MYTNLEIFLVLVLMNAKLSLFINCQIENFTLMIIFLLQYALKIFQGTHSASFIHTVAPDRDLGQHLGPGFPVVDVVLGVVA